MAMLLLILSFFVVSSTQCMESPLIETTKKQLTLECAAVLWQNHKHKSYQEDKITCAKLQKGHFLGVYDGHCSHRSDNNVSSFLQENFHKLFEQSEKETIQERLEDAFCQAETYALAHFADGSTAVVAYIDEKQILHLAWVGDSRAVLEKNYEVVYATKDHDTLRSIGDKESKDLAKLNTEKTSNTDSFNATPDYHSIQLTPENNFLILATDGVWFDVNSTEAVELVRAEIKNPMEGIVSQILQKQFPIDSSISSSQCDESIISAAQNLGVTALRRGSQDNIGILIAQLKWQEL
jgi:serine/threonine protein phosphatase PrpC